MAVVTGFTAARMAQIEAACIVGGAIVLDDLVLTRYDGVHVNAGNVRGPQGLPGLDGEDGAVGPAGPSGAPVLIHDDPFSVDNFASYTAHEGTSKTGLVVSGGTLGCSDANGHEFHNPGAVVSDTAKHTLKIIPGAANAWIYNLKKWISPNNFLMVQVTQSDTNMTVYSNVGGTYTMVVQTSHGILAANGPHWLVLRHAGNYVTGEIWRSDPALEGQPYTKAEGYLNTAGKAALGAGISGYPGARFHGYNGANAATDWRMDDWKVVNGAVIPRSTF
jgi:hypothetical protein